ncbi:N-acetylglucosamine kinase [Streptomyces montanisoli]|uniref:ATPase n=1 Tax=Streptomyces montanisoli TaxID=2798581 RepID=A0A940MCW5_9ACTN|nr:BadF/BadG/BcrA/BcrD ATPase family protein [Streptomyces montanisoli]MBP0457317.1 ATPase [Streptomyces montanisoli]
MTAHDLVLGIDAGGTRTRAAVATAAGGDEPPLGTGTAGPGNALSVAPDVLAAHLRQAVADAVPPALRPAVRSVAAGLAGCSALPGNVGADRARAALGSALAELGVRPDRLSVHGDTEIAFAGAPGAPADGLVLIAGTGAVAARITGGRTVATSDGDGWLLGDDGSGFWIGRRAVRAALAQLDGRGAPTLLATAVHAYYLDGPAPGGPSGAQVLREQLVQAVHERPVLDLAALSPAVADAARRGDPVARRIMAEAAKRLAGTLASLGPRPGDPLVTTGALLGPGGVLLPALRRRLTPYGVAPHPVPDGLPGALALARAALTGAGAGG